MKTYLALKKNTFSINNFSIVPIRHEDRFEIMKWRNEQIYHLRQNEILTEENQERYFTDVISKLFEQEQPNQILFSFLENNVCIGYGGLVHINWIDKNGEISFIMNTILEDEKFYAIWTTFLYLIEKVAFNELKFHKIFTYALDLRPKLYQVLDDSGFIKEAILKKHCLFNSEYVNVVIHSKFREK